MKFGASALLLGIVLATSSHNTLAADELSRIEQSIEANSDIRQISTAEVESDMEAQQSPYLFDVRTQREFDVSHLKNAIRVDPDSDPAAFLKNYGNLLAKEAVVFYCSTGRRSTELAEKVAIALNAEGKQVPSPVNMKGGIFRWHNESRPLVDKLGETDYVHPYNWYWKRLLQRKEYVRYLPRQ